jgi:hypothetical protein
MSAKSTLPLRWSAVSAVAMWVCLCVPAKGQSELKNGDQGGISSPLLSRCAGKFGGELRAADNAFPLFGLLGAPWMTIEQTDQKLDGAHVVIVVTGIGSQGQRNGAIAPLRYRCLIDDKGAAVTFTWNVLPSSEVLPPAMLLRGLATYQPKAPLAPGTELRVQLLDQATDPPLLLTEVVERSTRVNPIPFGLRLPTDLKLERRKLVMDARLSLGALTLYRLKQLRRIPLDQLQQTMALTIDAVVPVAMQ